MTVQETLEKRLQLWKELLSTNIKDPRFFKILEQLEQTNITIGDLYEMKQTIDSIVLELNHIKNGVC